MRHVLPLFPLLLVFICCQRNPLHPDVSGIAMKLEIQRLDQQIFEINAGNQKVMIPQLRQTYGSFFEAYNEKVLALGNSSDSSYTTYLNAFLTDSMRVLSRVKIDSVFKDLTSLTKSLEDGFRHYNYYFPDKAIPQIFTIISGFNQSVAMTTEAIGISLDNYLGAKCPFYVLLGLPEFKRANMYPEKIPFDVLLNWGMTEFAFDDVNTNLISEMIDQGKMLYFLDAMFPDQADYLKIGYPPEKLAWCEKNESGMWTYLVEHRLLFSTDRMNIIRFMGAGPFTSSFTTSSPGRTGAWMGWQIVRRYMKKNPGITLQALMAERDAQKILNESGYSPED